ncbi:hypothetical protein EG329_003129 [Mollisiaceae sp. DMI_Dod_QoI]|nr:hypothetical protein EG329_003129 [Helotiales sp. DMI_Dod_QoI]
MGWFSSSTRDPQNSKNGGTSFKESLRLQLAIDAIKRELKYTPEDDPEYPNKLASLGKLLNKEFDQTLPYYLAIPLLSSSTTVKMIQALGAMKPSDESIRLLKQAITMTPKESLARIEYMGDLGDILVERSKRTDSIKDLDEGIQIAEQAVLLMPENYPGMSRHLHKLGNMFARRAERMGDMEDLEQGIQAAERATRTASEENPVLLSDIAQMLAARHRRAHRKEDIDEAIHLARRAVEIAPKDQLGRAKLLNSLGTMLGDRTKRGGKFEDLLEAIRCIEEAIELTPKKDLDRIDYLDNLASRLEDRYRFKRDMKDLDEAIRRVEQALSAASIGDLRLSSLHKSRGQKLVLKSRATDSMRDMYNAVRRVKWTLKLLPQDHPERGEVLEQMADLTAWRYLKIRRMTYYYEAIETFKQAVESETSQPLSRFRAAQKAGILCVDGRQWNAASMFFRAAINLLPMLSSRTLSLDDQQYVIGQGVTFSSFVALSILQDGRPASEALASMEASRGIIASLAIDSRSDVSDLKNENQELHDRYIDLRNAVSSPSSISVRVGGAAEESSVAAISKRMLDLRELQSVEDKIRKLPGFERFQLPQSPAQLMSLAEFGPIVCFNVTNHGCHAFIVTKTNIKALPLPELNHSDVNDKVERLAGKKKLTTGTPSSKSERNREMRSILEWLWTTAVSPVLEDLSLVKEMPPAKLPRIWWVTSGVIGLLPVHAAGRDWGSSLQNTASHVASSYIPTFKSLAYARQRNIKSLSEPGQKFMVVSMPKTKGMKDLKVDVEVAAVEKSAIFFGMDETIVLKTPSREEVLKQMHSVRVAHFVCHGQSEPRNPSNSGLLLREHEQSGKASRLMVRDIAALSLEHAQIAYLSACSTAENASKRLMDEGIHVASGFHLVGFPHVIGTIWEASNKTAVEVAKVFYQSLGKRLKENNLENNNDVVAYALNDAVKALWGNPKARKKGNEDVIGWAPFIHIGA